MSALGEVRPETRRGFGYIRGVATIRLDRELCNGCQQCTRVCPHPVFTVVDKKVELDQSGLCMECGACVTNCETGALRVNPGVGCAAAILRGWVTRSEPSCGCSSSGGSSGGCC